MMSAGSFIVACMRKSTEALASSDVERGAVEHEIPPEWARFYLNEELNRSDRRR